jgi:hypothetical protein
MSSSLGNVTPALPTYSENDILLLCVQSCNEAIAAPAGYSEVTNSPQGTGTAAVAGSVRLAVFWKRASSSESSPTVTDTGDHTNAFIVSISGCITSGDPFDVTAGDVEATGSAVVTCPGVTTTGDRELIVNIVANPRDSGSAQLGTPTNADLTDLKLFFQDNSTVGLGGGLTVFTGLKVAAGAVASTTSTVTSCLQARVTLALKPLPTAVPYVVDVGATAGNTAAITPGVPPGYAADDIFFLLVETANAATVSAPTGYTEVTNSPQGTGVADATSATKLSLFWKRASGSESDPTVADSGDHQTGVIVAIRGCITSGDPWEASAGDVATPATTAVSMPAVTTLDVNRVIVHCLSVDTWAGVAAPAARINNDWANAALDYVAEVVDFTTSAGNDGGCSLAVGLKATAGSIGNTTATSGASNVQGRITLSLIPSAGGGGGGWVPRVMMF